MNELDLINAAKEGNIKKIEEALKIGLDINVSDNRGYTAILWATQRGHKEILSLLIKSGANIESKHELSRGYTPLIVAAINGQEEIIKILINSGANINAKNNKGQTAISVASEKGHTKIVELLTDYLENENTLLQATIANDVKTVQSLIEKGININAKNNEGCTALMFASNHGYTQIAKMLIDSGANVNAKNNDGDTAFIFASDYGHTEIISLFKAVQDDEKALRESAKNGNIKMVQLLIDKGINVNAKNNNDGTALISASNHGHTEIVKLLIDSGADVNAKNNNGSTALLTSSLNGHTQIAKMLIDTEADVNAKNNNGMTALMNASIYERTEIIELLKAAGATE